jgi:hypothetical protein
MSRVYMRKDTIYEVKRSNEYIVSGEIHGKNGFKYVTRTLDIVFLSFL